MPSYILRNIQPELWKSVKERARLEGLTLREIALALLSAYASRKVSVSGASMTAREDASERYGWQDNIDRYAPPDAKKAEGHVNIRADFHGWDL